VDGISIRYCPPSANLQASGTKIKHNYCEDEEITVWTTQEDDIHLALGTQTFLRHIFVSPLENLPAIELLATYYK